MSDAPVTVKIAKWIASHGICSRRAAERFVADGRVTINGAECRDVATRVTPGKDLVKVDGQLLKEDLPDVRIWRFHKPKGCLTSASDPEGRDTIYDLLPREMQELKYVGRLDYNTEGLLLLTNSGALAEKLTAPSAGIKRVYRVRTFGRPDKRRMQQVQNGAVIDGMRYRPVEISAERRNNASQLWYRLTLSEGKNREIRILMEYCDLKVTRLIRTKYGEYSLGALAPGDVAEDKAPFF